MSNTKPMMEFAFNFATFKSWIEDNEALLVVAIGVLAIAVAIIIAIVQSKRKNPDPQNQKNIYYSKGAHEKKLEESRETILKEMESARGEELATLQQELAKVNADINDPEASYQAKLEEINSLTAELENYKNEIDPKDYEAALEALQNGETEKADELFAQIEAGNQKAVQISADAAYQRGVIAEGNYDFRAAMEHFERAARYDPNIETLHKAFEFSWRMGDYKKAEIFAREQFGLAKSESNAREEATALNNLALALNAQGRYAEAEALYRQALEIDEKTIGKEHLDYASHLNNLAEVLRAQGRYEEAGALYRQALEIAEKTIGKEHPSYATRLNNLAGVLRAQERYEEAEKLFRQALEIAEKTIGKEHPDYATHLNNLAEVLRAQGRYEEAEELYRQALEIDEKTIGKEHPSYAIDLNNLAGVLKEQGRYEEARGNYEEALRILKNTLPEGHPTIEKVENNLAILNAEHPPAN